MNYVVKITVRGDLEIVQLKEPLFEWLQEQVGGYIEVIKSSILNRDQVVLLSEEGVYKGYKVNEYATFLLGEGRTLHGDVAIVKVKTIDEGNILTTLTKKEALHIKECANKLTDIHKEFLEGIM